MLETLALQRAMDCLLGRLAPADERLWAVIQLEGHLARCTNQDGVLRTLLRRQESRQQGFKSHMLEELYVTGAPRGCCAQIVPG